MNRNIPMVWKTSLVALMLPLWLLGSQVALGSQAATEGDPPAGFRANVDQINLGGTITIRGAADVTTRLVTLADIAVLEGDGAEALALFPVGSFSDETDDADQRSLTIRAVTLRRSLTELGVNWARMDLRGFHQCNVSLDHRPEVPEQKENTDTGEPERHDQTSVTAVDKDPQLVIARLREMINLIGADRPGRWSIDIPSDDQDWITRLPAGPGDALELEPVTATIPGRIIVTLRRFEGRDLVEQRRMAVQVTHHLSVVVAAGALVRNQPIEASSVRLEEMAFEAPISPPFLDLEEVVGQVPTMNLRSGAVLSKLTTRPPLAVSRGDDVTVQSMMGSVSISMRGRAMEEGRVGDVIRIQNPINRTVLHARLIAPRLARVGND